MELHPFITALVAAGRARPGLSEGSVPEGRALVASGRAVLGPAAEMASVQDITIDSNGAEIAARLLVPNGEIEGIIVYLHGGGWVLGEIEDFEILGRALAARSGCAVLLPGYRLAPEHPFPAGLDDAVAAIRWAATQGRTRLGAHLPLVVAGDSAGGNLATVALRKAPDVQAALQILLYPVTDSDMGRASYASFGSGLTLTTPDMRWFFSHYAPPELWQHPDIAPLRAPDLAGLPPAIVTLASHDVLHDEGLAYARALEAAGVPVTLRIVEGVTHGFIRLHNLFELAERELDTLATEIRAACRRAS